MNKDKLQQLSDLISNQPELSASEIARRVGIKESTIEKIKKFYEANRAKPRKIPIGYREPGWDDHYGGDDDDENSAFSFDLDDPFPGARGPHPWDQPEEDGNAERKP